MPPIFVSNLKMTRECCLYKNAECYLINKSIFKYLSTSICSLIFARVFLLECLQEHLKNTATQLNFYNNPFHAIFISRISCWCPFMNPLTEITVNFLTKQQTMRSINVICVSFAVVHVLLWSKGYLIPHPVYHLRPHPPFFNQPRDVGMGGSCELF